MTPRRKAVPGTTVLGTGAIVAAVLLALVPTLGTVGTADPTPIGANVLINSGFGASRSPALAAEPWGRVHAVWQDNRTGAFGIYYARSSDFGATWAPDRRLDTVSPGNQSFEADVQVDVTGGPYNGSVYVVWQTPASGIWMGRSPDGGATWNPAMRVDSAPSAVTRNHPSVAVGSGGTVYVAWADSRDTGSLEVFLRYSVDAGVTWSPEIPISGTGLTNLRPSVVANGDAVYVAWLKTDRTSRYSVSVAASDDGGATWQTSDAVSRVLPERLIDFDVSVGPAGDVHLAWIAADATGAQAILYARSDELGRTFTRPAVVASTPTAALSLREDRITVLGPVVAVVWTAQPVGPLTGGYDIYYAWSDGGAWSDPIRVDDTGRNTNPADDQTTQDQPAITGSGSVLYFAWRDARNSATYTDIYGGTAEWHSVLITEARDSPGGQQFVELYGWSRTPVPVSGWSLEIDGARYDIGALGSIRPGQHVTVGDFPTATLPLPITLDDQGSSVRLLDSASGVVDAMGYGQKGIAPDPMPGQSTARYSDGLEYSRSWTWTATPTPGARNAVPPPMLGPPVVLNQIVFNPSIPSGAFAELYYRGNATVRVSGLNLLGNTQVALPAIDFSPAQRVDVLPASAVPGLFSSLLTAGDNLYLTDVAGRFWDEAGWSSPHQTDMAMARAPDGEGSHDGYDDPSSTAAGWVFDTPPSLPGVSIGPDQSGLGDLGTVVRYNLTVTNELRTTETVELNVTSGPTGWRADLLAADGVTPLTDSNGDGGPDLPSMAPSESRRITVVVHIPAVPPIGDTELTRVSAFAYSNPLVRGNAWLSTATMAHIEPIKRASPTTIYVEGSPPPLVTQTTVHLEILGAGQAVAQRFPQDTIFIVDSSGSMTMAPYYSDPTGLRIDAIKAYIDGMAANDRAAIVGFGHDPDYNFDFGAWLVNDVNGGQPAHLTWMDATGKTLMKNNAETMRFGLGGTNIEKALQTAHQELLPAYRPGPACLPYARPFPAPPAGGMRNHTWVEILLTDGMPSHAESCTDDEVAIAAANNVRIFTIGLGPFVNETYLLDIASRSGGKYYKATNATDLLRIYDEIATYVNRVAGYDPNVTDDVPMIKDVVPGNVHIVPGSFVDPATGTARAPAWQGTVGGQTVLEWNVSQLRIGQSWAVEYRVSTPQVGRVPVSVYPDAAVTYVRWDGRQVVLSFPPTEVTVLPLAPPVTYTFARVPSRGDVLVDGVRHPAPWTTTWTPGGVHDISVPTVDMFGVRERDLFERWDDGLDADHLITVGTRDEVITAYFLTQFLPTVDLVGTDAAHTVAAHYSFQRQAASDPGVSGTWSGWVDAGTALSFDPLASGSNGRERWITARDFTVPPWDAVSSGFTETVVYVHQAVATIRTSGLRPSARAAVLWQSFGAPMGSRTSGTWSDWTDVGSSLSIENPVQVSAVQRYASRDPDAWTVAGPLDEPVRYYRQWSVRVLLVGLEASRPTGLRAVQFGTGLGASPWSEWRDWVDDNGTVSVDPLIMAGPRERFITGDGTDWTITSAATLTVHYAHEYRPSVTLLGTDGDHNVSLVIRVRGAASGTSGVQGAWTGWVESGGRLEFSTSTTGTPTLWALDPTDLAVDRPFDATIRYAPAEANLKPLISLVFVLTILGVAAVAAYRRPLDIFLLPSDPRRTPRPPAKGPARFRLLDEAKVEWKVRRDRQLTFLATGATFACAEGLIGAASLLTGVLRVPEAGSWVCAGVIVNTLLLISAIVAAIAMYRRGYRPEGKPRADESAPRAGES